MAGRKRIEPTPEVARQVEQLAAIGVTQEDAANILGFCVEILVRNYGEEWKRGMSKAKAKIAGKLFEKAMRGDSASIFFWLKTQAGWREVQRVDHTSSDGSMSGPMDVRVKFVNAKKQTGDAE